MERSGQSVPAADPEQLLEAFEHSWMEGVRPDLAEFFLKTPLNRQREVLMELVKVDLEFCWIKQGVKGANPKCRLPVRPRLDDYVLAYPELGSINNMPLDMIVEEFRVRLLAGDAVTPEDYRQRFPDHDGSLVGLLKQTQKQMSADYSRLKSKSNVEPDVSAAEFISRLSASGILKDAQVQEFRKKSMTGSRALARSLVQQRILTEFQAELACCPNAIPLLLGDYLLEDRLGKGGMGVVYKARHRRMQRSVALKVLPDNLAQDADLIKRFEREVIAAARLLHPNIVTAFDAGDQDGTLFMVMEYVDGLDLGTVVCRRGRLSPDEVIAVIVQATRGLVYAHGQGIVHRDIKPSNLLLSRSGTVKVLDLGLARLGKLFFAAGNHSIPDDMTGTGTIMGTVDYMAPEQAADTRQADVRSDIYSLGCTLYFLLTGKPIFAGESTIARVLAHREQAPPSLVSVVPGINPSLDAIFQRMVAKRPDDRYPIAEELQLDLLDHFGGQVPEVALSRCIAEALRFGDASTMVPGEERKGTGSTIDSESTSAQRKAVSDGLVNPQAIDDEYATLAVSPLNGNEVTRGLNPSSTPSSESPTGSSFGTEYRPDASTQLEDDNAGHHSQGSDQRHGDFSPRRRMSRLQFLLVLAITSAGFVTGKRYWKSPQNINTTEIPADVHSALQKLGASLESPKAPLVPARTGVIDADLSLLSHLPKLEELDLSHTRISDDGLKQLKSLRALRSLNLEDTSITDSCWESLADLGNLEVLRLGGTIIGDHGVEQLKSLPKLKEVSLSGTAISRVTASMLGRCANLEILELEQTNIDDQGISSLGKLSQLRILNLTGCHQIGNDGVAELRQCTMLEKLDLGRTSVGDRGLSALTSLKNLKQLWLDQTPVTSESLKSLANLKTLEWLSLAGTSYSARDVEQLRSLLPNCRVTK